jgi:hypothetical protein
MIPKEYQKSNLELDLKAGKKRLEDALLVMSDEVMREGREHAVGFGNGCSVRVSSHGVFGADGSFRPTAGITVADSSYGCDSKNRPVVMGNPEGIGSSVGLVPRNALGSSPRIQIYDIGCSHF